VLPRHVYVHVPFCARRCSYCDFSIAVRRVVPVDEFIAGIARELSLRFAGDEPWTVDTLYLGGGTPSLLGGAGVTRLLDGIRSRLVPGPGAEITLEANPDDVIPDSVRAWRRAGVTRLSLGSQTFDDRALAWMHRTHKATQIDRAVEVARAEGIDNLCLDLIFALPQALGRDWESDLERAVALSPEHLSIYGLTVEPATPLGRWRDRGLVLEASEVRYERDFLVAHDRLTAAGFEHYEVSNYARPGRRSRHNSAYWRHVPYAGVGPSAHSFDGTRRRWNVPAYAAWLRELGGGRDPLEGQEVLSDESRLAERIYLGLRTSSGIQADAAVVRRVQPWIDAGWAVVDTGRIVLTPTGWLRLDALAADLTFIGSRS
jgi:oxygen-independent coproporphyrinogen III oxidase